jgi:hypothetical protein
MGGGEEGSHVWRGDSVRRDKVMCDVGMHRPHDIDTYVGRSELSIDAKESDSAHREPHSRRWELGF